VLQIGKRLTTKDTKHAKKEEKCRPLPESFRNPSISLLSSHFRMALMSEDKKFLLDIFSELPR
jgi:hypothetical protein